MENVSYVIYGAGYRGEQLCNYIKAENVLAFIDSDKEKQGKNYCGKPIISLEQYTEKYAFCYIVITPALYENAIASMLEASKIYQYSSVTDMPIEFMGYGGYSIEKYCETLMNTYREPICLYGLNVFSLLIYDFLKTHKKIFLCPEIGCKPEKLHWINKHYPDMQIREYEEIKNEDIIFSTIGLKEGQFANRVVNLYEWSNDNQPFENKQLQRLKNIYEEKKRCFIIATGPSLQMSDLYKLKTNNIFCFGVNDILKIEKEWIPDAYVVEDRSYLRKNIDNIKKYKCKFKFITGNTQEQWGAGWDDTYRLSLILKKGKNLEFSEAIEQKIYSGDGTVAYFCMQIAVYMGFREIYLIGMDCNYEIGSKNNHFISEEMADREDYTEMVRRMINECECAKRYANAHGVKIYNATRGGKLEVFERVDFDKLF